MSDLWPDEDEAAWSAALAAYPDAIRAHGASRLPELDVWYREELPRLLRARTPPSLTLAELVRVTEWKMKRGAWRARNLALVRGNPAAEVERAAAEAFALAPDPRRPVGLTSFDTTSGIVCFAHLAALAPPVARLAALAGVGPATASAALAAFRPDVYPFFDELVAAAVPDLGPVAFTLPYYLRYADRLRRRATALGGGWTPHAVSQALWSHAAHHQVR